MLQIFAQWSKYQSGYKIISTDQNLLKNFVFLMIVLNYIIKKIQFIKT